MSDAIASDARPSRPRETIAAVSTAPGKAAIAVIRVSGPDACAVFVSIAGRLPEPRRAAFRAFRNPRTGELVDRGMALWLPGPGSATSEDITEFHAHGGRAVVAAVLDAVLSVPGVRPADAGEFTRRAFVAGRMDLAEVEGLSDLLSAETEAQRRQAVLQSEGALSAVVDRWRERLVGAMALVEAGIDFSDEDDVSSAVRGEARIELEALSADMAAALADTRAERLRDGFRVTLAGRPNAGKSSILNALARREAAIVTETPGTTRDVIDVHLDLDGLPVLLSDTAGIRTALDAAEREGVKRAEARAEAADLVLWIEDATDPAEPTVEARLLWRVINKVDLQHDAPAVAGDFRISTRTGAGLDDLTAALASEARAVLGSGEEVGVTRARHRAALAAALDQLGEALAHWTELPDEVLAELLRRTAEELSRITGAIGVEDVLDRVFSTFCIGK